MCVCVACIRAWVWVDVCVFVGVVLLALKCDIVACWWSFEDSAGGWGGVILVNFVGSASSSFNK